MDLFQCARQCIEAPQPDQKLALTRAGARAWREGTLSLDVAAGPVPISTPGRPQRPELVRPAKLARRKLSNPAGRAAFLHALAHIEFNAINLAWDAVYRFRGMPQAFYSDWIGVAEEEAQHFGMLRQRLRDVGHDYGDFPAHDGLWEMAVKTAHDVLVRMALVPRVLEARGLDVTPAMIQRLQQAGDTETAGLLKVILRDEIGHVAHGSRWFRFVCRQRGLEPVVTFQRLLGEYLPGSIRSPLNTEARKQAGFGEDEMELLQRMAQEKA